MTKREKLIEIVGYWISCVFAIGCFLFVTWFVLWLHSSDAPDWFNVVISYMRTIFITLVLCFAVIYTAILSFGRLIANTINRLTIRRNH